MNGAEWFAAGFSCASVLAVALHMAGVRMARRALVAERTADSGYYVERVPVYSDKDGRLLGWTWPREDSGS